MIHDSQGHIDCIESGKGPTLLFLPGSYSTPAAWRAILKLLPPGYRTLTTSLLGYGGTDETRTPDDPDMRHEVRIVRRLARDVGDPVHLVGHSFGGAVALAAALSGEVPVASLTLFEANPLALMRTHGRDDLFQDTWRMSRAFEAAVEDGEWDAAARIIDFWGGAGSFAGMPEMVQAYCRQTVRSNVLDWRTAFDFAAGPSDYARLDMPVLLVRSERANPAMVVITDALAECLPQPYMAVVPGANHFLVSSHAPACADLLGPFLARASAVVG